MTRDPTDARDYEPARRVALGTSLHWLAGALLFAALLVGKDFAGTVVLASWFVTTFWSWRERFAIKTGFPRLVSVLLTTAIVVAIVAPFTLVAVYVGLRAGQWVEDAVAAFQQGKLQSVFAAAFAEQDGQRRFGDLYRQAAGAVPSVLSSVGTIFHVVSDLIVKTFLFILGTYSFFANGGRIVHWIERGSPLHRDETRHLMKVYIEAGRGILVGVFLIIIVHGVVAVLGYVIIGVPRPVELGVLTALAGLVPAIGTGLVWVPLAAALALTGHPGRGLAVLVLGLVIGSVDNLFRPYLSRLGNVPLPPFALFVAFFGGIAAFGASGILLGPLVFSLAKGAIDLVVAEKERALAARIS